MRSQLEPDPGVLFAGPLTRAQVPILCDRLRLLVYQRGLEIVTCDVRELGADLGRVEALAQLQLTAQRLGSRIRLRRLSPELAALLDWCGLAGLFAYDELALG